MKNPNPIKIDNTGNNIDGYCVSRSAANYSVIQQILYEVYLYRRSNIGSGYYIWNNICQMSLLRKSFVH